MTYGLQLWACTCKTNLQKIQTFQNKVLRNIVNAPWYITNTDLNRDLEIEMIKEEVKKVANRHKLRLLNHVNSEMTELLNTSNLTRRLKRVKPFDLAMIGGEKKQYLIVHRRIIIINI